ncbi:MAG: SGNH/GDSL hydrolase family protein [Gammaproteobacteria bacterium]|nr:SGNH/GDSL hydrolase family protein [Gammaproteobacteria bacterium]
MKLNNRSKSLLASIAVFIFIILLLAFAEGATRLRQWLKYGSFGQLSAIYATDPETNLRVPKSNTKTGSIDINSHGFRGPELKNPKPTKSLRIAFLGASTTFCAEVSSNELTWPHLVAQQLQENYPNIPIEYVNGAVPGYTVSSSLRNLRERIAPLEPDIIIIYHATNDLSVETRDIAKKQSIIRDGEIEGNSWFADYSLLWFLVEKNLRLIKLQNDAEKQRGRLQFDPTELGSNFRTELTELVREAQKVSRVVALVTFSQQIRNEQSPELQLKAASSALYYMPFMTPEGLIASFSKYNEIIKEVGRKFKALIIDGEMSIPGDEEHFNDTVHFKDKGSKVMAQRVSTALLKSVYIKTLVESKLVDRP